MKMKDYRFFSHHSRQSLKSLISFCVKSLIYLSLFLGFTGCKELSNLLGDVMITEGTVKTPEGDPVADAEIKVYTFLDNLDAFGLPEDPIQFDDPSTYSIRVSIGHLLQKGKVEATILTDEKGKFEIEDLPLDGLILIASKEGYSNDIKGMDRETGKVSLKSALKPERVDIEDINPIIRANFIIAGGGLSTDSGGEEMTPPLNEEADPQEHQPLVEIPEVQGWETFILEKTDGVVIADASTQDVTVSSNDLPTDPQQILYVKAAHSDPQVEKAYLRIQHGSEACSSEGYGTQTETHLLLFNQNRLVSNGGGFQAIHYSGGYQRFQLDLDEDPNNGNESHIITVEEECKPTNTLVIKLMWDLENVDVDLYVWNEEEEVTNVNQYYEGEFGRSSYGRIELPDRRGFGPEIFTLSPGKTGKYKAKAHVFCGPSSQVNLKVNVGQYIDGQWVQKNYDTSLSPNEAWVDLGQYMVE